LSEANRMNYDVLLGVPQDADPHAIRSAFRARARQY
jgi:DnaJ-class molecular chaperone